MSNKSNDLGRAFEYACLIELKDRITDHRPVLINEESAEAAHRAWNLVSAEQQNSFLTAADAFVDTLFQADVMVIMTS